MLRHIKGILKLVLFSSAFNDILLPAKHSFFILSAAGTCCYNDDCLHILVV